MRVLWDLWDSASDGPDKKQGTKDDISVPKTGSAAEE